MPKNRFLHALPLLLAGCASTNTTPQAQPETDYIESSDPTVGASELESAMATDKYLQQDLEYYQEGLTKSCIAQTKTCFENAIARGQGQVEQAKVQGMNLISCEQKPKDQQEACINGEFILAGKGETRAEYIRERNACKAMLLECAKTEFEKREAKLFAQELVNRKARVENMQDIIDLRKAILASQVKRRHVTEITPSRANAIANCANPQYVEQSKKQIAAQMARYEEIMNLPIDEFNQGQAVEALKNALQRELRELDDQTACAELEAVRIDKVDNMKSKYQEATHLGFKIATAIQSVGEDKLIHCEQMPSQKSCETAIEKLGQRHANKPQDTFNRALFLDKVIECRKQLATCLESQ